MDTGSDKDNNWHNWDRAEIRRLASREAQLLQELGLTMGDPALEPARVKLTPPWTKVEVLSTIEAAAAKAVAAQMFTGRGGAGSEGEFYDVQITNRGFRTDQARSTPMFGNPNAKVVDRRKFYDGKEFEESKLGGYGNLRYDVLCGKTGTPRDVSKSAKAVPNWGPKGAGAVVVDRRKFYNGYDADGKRADQAKLLGSYGPGWYDVRVNNKGNAAAVKNGTHDRELYYAPNGKAWLALALGAVNKTSAPALQGRPQRCLQSAGCMLLSPRHPSQASGAWWTTRGARPASAPPSGRSCTGRSRTAARAAVCANQRLQQRCLASIPQPRERHRGGFLRVGILSSLKRAEA